MRLARHVVSPLSGLFAVALAVPAVAQTGTSKEPLHPNPAVAPTPSGEPQFQPRISGDVVVGEPAPDFELDASTGEKVRLSASRGRWVILAFGDRKETVAPMRTVAASLDSANVVLLGVCNEKAYFLEAYHKQTNFPFPILADVTREISAMYGLDDSHDRTIQPGYVLIGPRGNVRFALLGETLPPDDVARLARYVAGRH